MAQTTETRPLDDFELAYRAQVESNASVMRLTAAVIKLTVFGEHPADVELVAAEAGMPVEDTLALLRQWDWAMHVEGHLVTFKTHAPDPDSGGQHRVIRMGGRVVDAGAEGCAPDLFAVVLWTGQAIQVEAACPSTGERIVVDITPEGVARVEPETAVISVADPRGPGFEDWSGGRDAYEQVCTQQNLYASAEAAEAAGWQTANPGGRLVPVREFPAWMRRVFPSER